MSTTQLLEIEKTLLETLTIEELKDFVFNLLSKKEVSKKKYTPKEVDKMKKKAELIPAREPTLQEALAIEEGLASEMATDQEIEELEKFLQMSLR